MSDEVCTEHENPTEDEDLAKVDRALAYLMEHFDTAQVFVTSQRGEFTMTAQKGEGNWYARAGQIREWLLKEDERARVSVRYD